MTRPHSRREAFRQARERARDTGFTFILPDASITEGAGFEVRLRRLSLQEKAAVNGITQSVQDEVYRRTRDLAEWQSEMQRKKVKPADQLDFLKESETLVRSVNAVCCAAWIDPVLVETDAALTANPDAWHVDDFTVDDRWAAFRAITDGDSQEAKSLRLFRPASTSDAPAPVAVPDAAPTKRGAATRETGDQ